MERFKGILKDFLTIGIPIWLIVCLIFDSQYDYVSFELIDEWVWILCGTIVYIPLFFLLRFLIKKLIAIILKYPRNSAVFIGFFMFVALFSLMAYSVAKNEEEEKQDALRRAERNSHWVEEANRELEQMYLKASIKAMEDSQNGNQETNR